MDVFARRRRAHAEQTVAWSITNAHQQAIRCSDLHVFDGAVDGWSSQAATDWPWAEEGAGRDEDIWLVGEEGLVVLKDALTGEEGTRDVRASRLGIGNESNNAASQIHSSSRGMMKGTGREMAAGPSSIRRPRHHHGHHGHHHQDRAPPAAVLESAIDLPGTTRETRGRVSADGSKSSLRLSAPLIRPRHFTCTFPSYSSHPPTTCMLCDGLHHLFANRRRQESTHCGS